MGRYCDEEEEEEEEAGEGGKQGGVHAIFRTPRPLTHTIRHHSLSSIILVRNNRIFRLKFQDHPRPSPPHRSNALQHLQC